MSVAKFLYHLVLRTRYSVPALTQDHERDVYLYLYSLCKRYDCVVHRIGGMPDHVHLLLYIPPKIAVSTFVQNLKSISSTWIESSGFFPAFQGWGKEYAAFTYAYSQRDTVVNYIKNQKEHHRVRSFREELESLLAEYNDAEKVEFLLRD